MSGHNKWSNIKHRKAIQDNRKSKLFTKLLREIAVSARINGANINSNHRLRIAIAAACNKNISKSTINKAIEKSIYSDNFNLKELRYEGYGPAGVAFIIDCITNNRNRTASKIRYAFAQYDGKLGPSGSVFHMFHYRGIISLSNILNEDYIFDIALQMHAKDIVMRSNGVIDVITDYDSFYSIKKIFSSNKHCNVILSKITLYSNVEIKISDFETINKIINAVNRLNNLEDVQRVYHNAVFCKK